MNSASRPYTLLMSIPDFACFSMDTASTVCRKVLASSKKNKMVSGYCDNWNAVGIHSSRVKSVQCQNLPWIHRLKIFMFIFALAGGPCPRAEDFGQNPWVDHLCLKPMRPNVRLDSQLMSTQDVHAFFQPCSQKLQWAFNGLCCQAAKDLFRTASKAGRAGARAMLCWGYGKITPQLSSIRLYMLY